MYTTDQEKGSEQYCTVLSHKCCTASILRRSTFRAIVWPKRECGITCFLIIGDRAACRNLHRAAPTSTRSLFTFTMIPNQRTLSHSEKSSCSKAHQLVLVTVVDVNARSLIRSGGGFTRDVRQAKPELGHSKASTEGGHHLPATN
jgi:hypothetical protein